MIYSSPFTGVHIPQKRSTKVTDDIFFVDKQKVTILTLLDLRDAFDTLPHDMFLCRLESQFEVGGLARKLFESYFDGRLQQVKINQPLSTLVSLERVMPQGSGLPSSTLPLIPSSFPPSDDFTHVC